MKTPHPFHILVPREPVDIWEKLKQLATRNRRTIKEEVLLAIEDRLKSHKILKDKTISS